MSRRPYLLAAAALAAAIVLIALFVRDDFIRPYGGDVLVTAFLCAAVRTVLPRRPRLLPLWVFLFAAAVEIGQFFGLVDRLGLGGIPFFRIALGTTFSLADLLCYAVGCALFWAVEHRARTAAANLRHNRALADTADACRGPDGLCHGQRREPLGTMRFGFFSVGRSGCGPIGICNALRLLGTDIPLPDVIAACEWGTPIAGAAMGLSPLNIPAITRRLLHRAGRHDLRVRGTLLPPETPPANGALILTHLNGKKLKDGAHTVAVYAAEDGTVCVANAFNRSSAAMHCASIETYLRGRYMLYAVELTRHNPKADPAQKRD